MAMLRDCEIWLGVFSDRQPAEGTCDLRSWERWKYLVMLVLERAKHGIDFEKASSI